MLSWNAGAQRIKGYEAREIIGQHFSKFYPEEQIAPGEKKAARSSLSGRRRLACRAGRPTPVSGAAGRARGTPPYRLAAAPKPSIGVACRSGALSCFSSSSPHASHR